MLLHRHLDTPKQHSDFLTRYYASEIDRLHGAVDSQVFGMLLTFAQLCGGAGVLPWPDTNSFVVTAGTGLSVNVGSGAGLIEHSQYEFIYAQHRETQTVSGLEASRGSGNPLYLFLKLELQTPPVDFSEYSEENDTRQTALATFEVGDLDTLDGGILLAEIQTSSSNIVSVVDRRRVISFDNSDWSHGSGAPSDLSGDNGDYYLRTSNGAIYVKSAGTWSSLLDMATQAELDAHKTSSDHDGRYYTETETDTMLAAKADDSAVVHKTGAETIAGVKTFSSSPVVPTPSSATDAANKTYVDSAVGAAVTGALSFQGALDCSANPNYPSASKGHSYVVSVAGKIGGASGKSVEPGDFIVATADNAGGTEAGVGTSWTVLEHNLVGALLAANNLSDLSNAATARSNLGAAGLADANTFAQSQTFSALLKMAASTPATISSDQNDYAIGTTGVQRLSTDASRILTGLVASADAMVMLVNAGANNLVLAHQSTSSSASNRIIVPGAVDLTLGAEESCLLYYDSTAARWRVMFTWSTGSGGASAFTSLTDAPASYTGHGEKSVRVKSDESGLEFGRTDAQLQSAILDSILTDADGEVLTDGDGFVMYTAL